MHSLRSSSRRRSGTLAAVALAAMLALAGCGSSTAFDASAQGEAAAPADGAGGGAAVEEQAASDAGGGAASGSGVLTGAAEAAGQRRIRTAELTVEVEDLPVAAERVRQVAAALGGFVASETTGIGQAVDAPANAEGEVRTVDVGSGVIVLRVPEPDLDAAMTRVAATGKEVARTQNVQDVTGEIADVSSRIETQRQSVARTRELLGKATTVQDIVFIESELTKREAELEALQARLKSLSDRADLATLTAVLQVPGSPADTEPSTGFLAGLREGWKALVASTNVVLTVLGAVLPVAVVLAVVGYPASVLLRRRSARRAQEQQAAMARWHASQQQPAPTAQQPAQPPAQQPAMAGAAAGTPGTDPGAADGPGGAGPTP